MIIIYSNDADDEKQMIVTRTNLYSIQVPLSIDAVRCVMGPWLMRHHFDNRQRGKGQSCVFYSEFCLFCWHLCGVYFTDIGVNVLLLSQSCFAQI